MAESRAASAKAYLPGFVVELLSPSDRRDMTHAKMLEWIAHGVELGWMIDPKAESITVYRPWREHETRTNILEIAGEGPVEGIVLELEGVWRP